VWGWALYDWANSAFATTVMAGFFPIFFKQYWSQGIDANLSTARLGLGSAAAGLTIALLAPVLGAIADAGTLRKKFLVFFAYLGVSMTAALFWVGQAAWMQAILVYGVAVVGFSGANIFYDALLPTVADTDTVDYVSSLGYALGYLGGGLLFLLNVLMVLRPGSFGLADAGQAIRWAFVSVALWWGLFTLFLVWWVPEASPGTIHFSSRHVVRDGLRQLAGTLRRIRSHRPLWLFLIAYWFYIDGVDTIVRMAVDYGISIGLATNSLITALLIVQFVGFPAALAFGRLGERWGVRRTIFLGLGLYVVITLWGALMTTTAEFYGLAAAIGLVQGGVQALSRSYYARLIPPGRSAEYFGFYNMLGKFAAIVGPALMGATGLWVRWMLLPPSPTAAQITAAGKLASRWSIASVLVLFLIGGFLLYRVEETEGRVPA
ncbi:MAG: MFS transporter, partial [Desulfobacterales bacterium]|nr:MFS transporter [Desulfobacterales bacterium]